MGHGPLPLAPCDGNRTGNSRWCGLTCSRLHPYPEMCVHMTFRSPEHRSPREDVSHWPCLGFLSPSPTCAHLCSPGQEQREEALPAGSPGTSRVTSPAVLPAEVPPGGGHEQAPPRLPVGPGVQGPAYTRILRSRSGQSALASLQAWVVGVRVRGGEPQAEASVLLTWYVGTAPPSAHQALV